MSTLSARGATYGRAFDYELVEDISTSTPEGLTVPSGARSALVTAVDGAVRFRLDGGNPTPASGHYLATNGNLEVFGDDMENVLFVAVTGTVDIAVTYFRKG